MILKNFRGHNQTRRFWLYANVAGEQTDVKSCVSKIAKLLVADRFDWRGVDCSRAPFLSQRKSVLRNDGFARGSVRGDEDAFVAFDASDGFFLKRVQFKRKSFGW